MDTDDLQLANFCIFFSSFIMNTQLGSNVT